MTEQNPLTYRGIDRMKRLQQPLHVGNATLQWSRQMGVWQMNWHRDNGQWGGEHADADISLDDLNVRWAEFVSKNA